MAAARVGQSGLNEPGRSWRPCVDFRAKSISLLGGMAPQVILVASPWYCCWLLKPRHYSGGRPVRFGAHREDSGKSSPDETHPSDANLLARGPDNRANSRSYGSTS